MTFNNDDDDYEIEDDWSHELFGGPYDGCTFEITGEIFPLAYVKYGKDHVAIYEDDNRGRLAFLKFRRMGEGSMPDVYPDRDFIGGAQSGLF